MTEAQERSQEESQPYYASSVMDRDDNLRYRLDARDSIEELCEYFRGILYDENQQPIVPKTEGQREEAAARRLMSDDGIFFIKTWLLEHCTKMTHLTKYTNEDRVLRQMKHHSRVLLKAIVLNRKRWKVKNKDLILYGCEKLLFESMLRASEGFENNNISQTYIVQEQISRDGRKPQPEQSGGWFSWLRPGRRY